MLNFYLQKNLNKFLEFLKFYQSHQNIPFNTINIDNLQ